MPPGNHSNKTPPGHQRDARTPPGPRSNERTPPGRLSAQADGTADDDKGVISRAVTNENLRSRAKNQIFSRSLHVEPRLKGGSAERHSSAGSVLKCVLGGKDCRPGIKGVGAGGTFRERVSNKRGPFGPGRPLVVPVGRDRLFRHSSEPGYHPRNRGV